MNNRFNTRRSFPTNVMPKRPVALNVVDVTFPELVLLRPVFRRLVFQRAWRLATQTSRLNSWLPVALAAICGLTASLASSLSITWLEASYPLGGNAMALSYACSLSGCLLGAAMGLYLLVRRLQPFLRRAIEEYGFDWIVTAQPPVQKPVQPARFATPAYAQSPALMPTTELRQS